MCQACYDRVLGPLIEVHGDTVYFIVLEQQSHGPMVVCVDYAFAGAILEHVWQAMEEGVYRADGLDLLTYVGQLGGLMGPVTPLNGNPFDARLCNLLRSAVEGSWWDRLERQQDVFVMRVTNHGKTITFSSHDPFEAAWAERRAVKRLGAPIDPDSLLCTALASRLIKPARRAVISKIIRDYEFFEFTSGVVDLLLNGGHRRVYHHWPRALGL
jgi:hypothetical protein